MDRTPLTNVVHAFSFIIAMLVEDLEKAGAMSRPDFAKRLRDMADEAESTAPDHLKGISRADLAIARHVAGLLAKPVGSSPGWTPVVIDGGLEKDEDQPPSGS
ncbi:hypothetical protein AB7714_28240 [Tardiphaga sp. 1201_B9_N1_1]|uniref:hypothetical protein n=1 Tax=unclassified Tardiphaga TaxID=2631404 RepID=UPI003F297E10